jgi:hypothetical protein
MLRTFAIHSLVLQDGGVRMNEADEFYISMGKEVPQESPQTEAAISAALWFLSGIGFIAALIAVAIWSLK